MNIIGSVWGKGAAWRIQYFSFPIVFRLSSLQSLSVLGKPLEGYHDFLHEEPVLSLTLHFIK